MVCGDKVTTMDVSKTSEENELDVGEKMRQRALNSYGVGEFLKNIELLSSDGSENDVKYLWYWLDCKLKLLHHDIYLNIWLLLRIQDYFNK